ncbi:MAG: sugar ABC transporter permease [Propionicimonas sp.]
MAAVRRMSPLARREERTGWLWVQSWLVGFLLFTIIPISVAIYLSFTRWSGTGAPRWVGLENYARMVSDDLFWQGLKVTFSYALIFIPLNLVVGFCTALLMNQKLRGVNLFRAIYFLPSVLAGVAVAVLWQFVFSTDFGMLNAFLSAIGLPKVPWLTDPSWVLPAIVLMQLWGVGSTMIIYLGGLQAVPTELYEQARVDGAGAWSSMRHITIPMLTPVIFFQLIMGVIASFQIFTQPYIMTQGGPTFASYFYSIHIYVTAFQRLDFGYASALSVFLFLVVMVITLALFRSSRSWVHYTGEKGGA